MSEPKTPMTTVLKVGGSLLTEEARMDALGHHVHGLLDGGGRVVVVHGGGVEIAALHDALGVPTRKRSGLRVTPAESMWITTMVLCGSVNKRLVARLLVQGIPAMGLSGIDLGLLRADLINEPSLGRVGGPPRVDDALLRMLIAQGFVPVLAPVSLGSDGEPVNVNADTAAQGIAAALGADSLDFVSDVAGVLDGDTPLRRLRPDEVQPLIARSVVSGGMVPKLQAALAALDAGVRRVRVGSVPSLRSGEATEVMS